MRELWEKIKEALVSALPITLIVYLMALLPWFHFSGTELITFTIGAVLRDGFGVVALVAMAPLITIQLLGFRAIVSNRVKEKRAMQRILDADDQQIINFM